MSRRLSTRQQNNVKKATVAEVVSSGTDERPPPPADFTGVKQYHTEEQRLKSFTSPPARKRQSNAKKGSKAPKWSWPATHPAAELMARAGFYFKPTPGEEDNAACFLCQKNMSFWEPEDDPAEQHGRHGTTCGWALTMCRDLVVDGNMVSEPLGEEMCRARQMTFDQWWPHEDKKGWKPTVEKIVLAGFVFRPRGEGDDTVFCPYCSLSIDAWEKDDDPREAHESLGSGKCVFLQHTANAPISASEGKDNVLQPAETEEVEEKSTSKRRVSRARKAPATQRKKTTPKNKLDLDDPESKNGGLEGDGKDVKKTARGKKRGSAAMEEGGKKLLFSNKEESITKPVDGQRTLTDGHENQKPRPAKRRVTRASMVNQPSTLNLVVSVPDHLAQADDTEAMPLSLHSSPVKVKPKEKKKTTRSSTTATTKPAKGAKKTASKTPLNAPKRSDEEIDRELEQEIISGFSVSDRSGAVEEKALITAPESEEFQNPNEPTEPGVTQQPAKKATRRLTKTKPASRRSPSPNSADPLEDQEEQKTRRKGLTRTKPKTLDTTDTQSVTGGSTNLEGPSEVQRVISELLPPPQNLSDEATVAGGVESHGEPTLDCLDRANTPENASSATIPDTEAETLPQPLAQVKPVGSPPTKIVSETVPVEAAPAADGSNLDNDCSSEKNPSAQLVVTCSTSISPTKDKDMKRKSDVVTDEGQDRRTSKKRKTAKIIKTGKPRASPKKKETIPSIPSEAPRGPQQAEEHEVHPSRPNPQESTVVIPPKDDSAPAEVVDSHEDSTTEEQETILDDFGDGDDAGIGESRLAAVKGSTSDDNTIDAILNGYAGPRATSPQKVDLTDAHKDIGVPSSPSAPSDNESQDSIPNTQFSMPASQVTVATSFQGSVKGISFVKPAGEVVLAEHDLFTKEDIREQSMVVSPKQSRTPLSTLSKAHNGALALMTPRNRAEDISFAPVQSQKPWKSTDVELYIDGLKENQDIEPQMRGLPEPERDMTVAEWIMDVSKRAEKQLVQKGELLVKFFEEEAERAVSAIEAIETE
ncbi:hypothetical protein TWF730_010816 [Orbilia blumenaviensis]|uniref:Uncharacterized protein n=1 Tax=Orbilia blumenaviensis TaxID=1796055 RepID=A0AAV9UIX7_9PEZI